MSVCRGYAERLAVHGPTSCFAQANILIHHVINLKVIKYNLFCRNTFISDP